MIAIVEAHRAGLLARSYWLPNIVSGIVVGVVALPLAMAFAIASGVKPEQGLYTAIIAGLIVSLFGGSRLQIAGPTGAFIVILVGIGGEYGLAGLQTATVMAGGILILMGIFRLGAILKYIPDPVILGFTAGIGIIIFVGQWDAFFGLEKPEGEHFHEKFLHLVGSLPDLSWATTLLGAIGLATLLLWPRVPRVNRIPGPLVAMVVVTLVQKVVGFEGVATIGSAFGGIPRSLPSFVRPDLDPGTFFDLLGPAFTIAILCAIESLLSAMVADGMAGTRHDSNQELVGQGTANIVSALFGGIAATGAIARTATNIRNGATGPIAGATHSVTLILVIVLFAQQSASIPLAALAAILFVVAWNMSDARHVVRLVRRAPRADVAILLVTLGLTVFSDLVIAVAVGVTLATLQFLRRMAETVGVSIDGSAGAGTVDVPESVQIFTIEGPYFFAAANAFEHALATTHTDPERVVIRLGRVPFVDITGIHALEEVISALRARGIAVTLCEANPRVLGKLIRAGVIGRDITCHPTLSGALGT